ncbi:ADP-ribosyl-[dinitrogen reductase] hydrolase [Candidatus Pantoea varia]|uniref:ADP-ribosyl-[dinitrogen reductase] hydrolase n=1 Tax=Candidatus Pantoea varia TaxID=1881036 RepID=A0A1I4YZL6_9GAMM|nr:ADP-ribosyl-[dinitrogen reductase] hydrolase [Pantoea varia]
MLERELGVFFLSYFRVFMLLVLVWWVRINFGRCKTTVNDLVILFINNSALICHAPAEIFKRKSFIDGWRDASIQSEATHCAPESIDSCRYFNTILHYLLNGYGKSESLAPHKMSLLVRLLIINAGEYKEKHRDQIRSSGYVIDTLEAALWAVWHTDNFKDAILLAANLADDADSVAATAGQLAGALYGLSGIPQEWVDKIVDKDRILSMAEELFHLAPEETD